MALPLLLRHVVAAFCNRFCCVDLGNRWRKVGVVVAMKHFLVGGSEAFSSWECEKLNYHMNHKGCIGLVWQGIYLWGGGIPPEAFPMSDRANSIQLQHRPTPGQGWAHQQLWQHLWSKVFKNWEKKPFRTEAGREG